VVLLGLGRIAAGSPSTVVVAASPDDEGTPVGSLRVLDVVFVGLGHRGRT
jgi:hypothetical protein